MDEEDFLEIQINHIEYISQDIPEQSKTEFILDWIDKYGRLFRRIFNILKGDNADSRGIDQ